MMVTQKFYAVKQGRKTGVFTSWAVCKEQVQGFSGAVYKSFATLQEAQDYLSGQPDGVSFIPNPVSEETLRLDSQKTIHPVEGEMIAYVDGSFHLKKWMFAYGVVLFYDGQEYHFSGSDNEETMVEMRNVAGEIRGAEKAMEYALQQGAKVLHIYHDYEGIARWCTGEWQAKKTATQKYRLFYLQALQKGLSIQFHKVKGHSGNRYNELADQLAKEALGIK